MKTGLFLLSIVLLFVITLFGWYVWYNEQDKAALHSLESQVAENQKQLFPEPSPQPTPTDSTASASGTITGSLSFPSEVIPPMIICAETLESDDEFCTEDTIENDRFEYELGYEITVPVGQYYVYASLPNDPYRAYYNEFVVCGLSVECESHDKLIVEVAAGEMVTDIDPQDWYNRAD
ncbi:MAG: hypothetical protein WDZ94_00135 [Patescibacteria group bacterium]